MIDFSSLLALAQQAVPETIATPDLHKMSFSIFEVIMLCCFGASWPFAIWKTVKAKNPAGKSFGFAALILIGYGAGCLHKICYKWDWVFYLYLVLFALVCVDTILCLYYLKKLRLQANNTEIHPFEKKDLAGE